MQHPYPEHFGFITVNRFPDIEEFTPPCKAFGPRISRADARYLLTIDLRKLDARNLCFTTPRLDGIGTTHAPFNTSPMHYSDDAVIAPSDGRFMR